MQLPKDGNTRYPNNHFSSFLRSLLPAAFDIPFLFLYNKNIRSFKKH